MLAMGVGLCGVAIVPRYNAAQALLPFNLSFAGRPEIDIKHLVSNLFPLMGSLEVVVGKPRAFDVIRLIQAEAVKEVKALFLG